MALSPTQKTFLKDLRIVANELGEDGKNLTSLIGELSACDLLDMKWEPSTGYDSVDKKNNKVEIKTRRDSKGGDVNKRGRMGKFGKRGKYRFDYGLYVELDRQFEVKNIFKSSKKTLINLEQNEKQDRGLHISTFVKHAERIFSA